MLYSLNLSLFCTLFSSGCSIIKFSTIKILSNCITLYISNINQYYPLTVKHIFLVKYFLLHPDKYTCYAPENISFYLYMNTRFVKEEY